MNRLRNRLILVFLAATLVPLGATLWITSDFLRRSLAYSSTAELDRASRSLEATGRELYQRARAQLKTEAAAKKRQPTVYSGSSRGAWPAEVDDFFRSDDAERFSTAGTAGDRLDYFVRRGKDVWVWSEPLGIQMGVLHDEFVRARELVAKSEEVDLRRGLTLTLVVLVVSVWLGALVLLVYVAHRISLPIQELTAGLSKLAEGNLEMRVPVRRDDEVGRAIRAFNDMAARLKHSTERLVYLTQMASWQSLARKMAHEVKNSLTPIRLTVEEMLARRGEGDPAFLEQAAQIVVEEVESLERRIRAFSQFAAEPPVRPARLDINALLEERVAFLGSAHPETDYELRLAGTPPAALADADLARGILTNLLENAAQAAGDRGRVLGVTLAVNGKAAIEIHDSGPGLSEQVKASLFQPTISFKKGGMGLGLSIARKSALAFGGDIEVIQGELGGAAFRVLLPLAPHGEQARSDRG